MQENKNEITPNQPQQKIEHPAEKLMQYPLKSSGDGIPNTVIRNPELAEEFAYAEKPYRELALAAEGLGLEDEATNILRRGRAAVLRMGIEEDYYKKYDTTRSSVRRAIETGEPEWLNPNHGEVLADIELEKSNEALELQRRHVRALGGGNEGSYEKRYSPDTEAELRSYNKLVSAGGLFEALNYDGLKSTFLRKRRQTLGVLHASISWRKPEAKRSPLIEQAVDKELSEFFVEVYKLQEGGTINRRLAGQVIDRFDIARYTVDDFRAISSNFNFHNLGEMTNLLQGLYAHESNDDIISEHKAHRVEAEKMSNPMPGGLPGSSKRS